jgi:hypothetical protein
MPKKYIVRLTDRERAELTTVVKKLKGTSQKVRRAQILLKADARRTLRQVPQGHPRVRQLEHPHERGFL